MRIAFAALMITLMTVPLRAQWDFRTPGIPRLADGSPNLAAPPPRTADGKPDFSGVWKLEPTAQQTGIQDYLAGPEFGNIAARLNRPLPYQPWAEALVKERAAGLGKDDPVVSCWPGGTIRLYTYPPYRKIVQNAGLLVLLSERDVTFRQIFIDGRPLPKDPNPSFNGYSTGRWEKDTLVVQTIGFRDGIWLDRRGNPLTDAATMLERFRRTNFGNLEVEITINDPKAYTEAWTVKLHQVLVPDSDLLEYYCQENEKDAVHILTK